MAKESDLYQPILNAVLQRYRQRSQCRMWITEHGIPEEAKEYLNREAVYLLEIEKQCPDLTGYVSSAPYASYGRPIETVVIEVKKGSLALKDIYQLKRYAEILSADQAFLISRQRFPIAKRQFIQTHEYILSYGKCKLGGVSRWITVFILTNDDNLEFESELCKKNPFAMNMLEEDSFR